MVGVAQLVELRIVIPAVVGSSPIVHPTSSRRLFAQEGVSQVRESGKIWIPQWGISSIGRATDS